MKTKGKESRRLWASLFCPACVGPSFPEAGSSNGDQPVCLSLGKAIWTLNPSSLSNGTLAAPVAVLPDLDEDGVRDLVVLAIGEVQVHSGMWLVFLTGNACILVLSVPSVVVNAV